MSQENVEIVLDQYAATNERDFERVMSHYADDVELVAREPWIQTGLFRGREAVGRWFGDWLSTIDRDARFEVKEARELPTGAVLIVADHHTRGRASGVEVHGMLFGSTASAKEGSLGSKGSRLGKKRSKPPGCGSRRCRRRT
jgi:ketosteroid isomerase-like protein